MNLQALGRRILDSPIRRLLLGAGNRLLFREGLRRALFSIVDSQLQEAVRPKKDVPKSTTRIERERVLVARAVLATVDRVIGRRQISPRLMRVVTELWGRAWSLSAREEPNSRRFLEVHGCAPPWFLVLSPSNACNLSCPGCYGRSRGRMSSSTWCRKT